MHCVIGPLVEIVLGLSATDVQAEVTCQKRPLYLNRVVLCMDTVTRCIVAEVCTHEQLLRETGRLINLLSSC